MTRYGAIALLVIAPLSSAFLLELSLRNGCSSSRRRSVDRASVAALDADTLRDCAIYDAAMDAEVRELKGRVASAEYNAEQQRSMVEMAQATLWEQNKYKIYSSLANLMIIGVFGQTYEFIAYKLTEWENHRTKTEFEDTIISKNFGFQFVNNYFVLFYICFIRPFYSKCQSVLEDGSQVHRTAACNHAMQRC